MLRLAEIRRYPVKSCRGQPLETAQVEPWGLRGDRRWMLVDAEGVAVTARTQPRLVLVTPRLQPNGLRLSVESLPDLWVDRPDASTLTDVRVFSAELQAAVASPQAHAWFSALLGVPVRLVYLDDPTRRGVNPEHSRPADRVSLADGYPLLLTTRESLAKVNELILEGPHAEEGPLPMIRFRPNVVVSGAPAWAEDNWRLIRIGGVRFRVAKSCARCVLTTVHPVTGLKGREPLWTLARHRGWDGAVWFGINLIPDQTGSISVGDELEVLD
jgi:uncharacterized protein YcbX